MVNSEVDKQNDPALEQRSRDLFNERIEHLDGRTRSRLNQARQKALDAIRPESRTAGLRWLAPGAVAALTLVALVSWQVMRPMNDAEMNSSTAIASTVDDLEIITADEELELLQNMDFYAWVESEVDAPVNSGEAG